MRTKAEEKKFAELVDRFNGMVNDTLLFFADPDTVVAATLVLTQRGVKVPAPPVQKAKKTKSPPKSQIWSDNCAKAREALEELEGLREEWSDIYDRMSEGLQQGPYGQKCEAMSNLDLASAIEAVDEAEGLEVPLGFGRD